MPDHNDKKKPPLSSVTWRTCLRCSITFISDGPHNRICPKCSNSPPKFTNRTTNSGSFRARKGSNQKGGEQ